MPETIEVQSELVSQSPPAPNDLVKFVAAQPGLEPGAVQTLREGFSPLFEQAAKWKAQAASVRVTDVSQVREMKMAREIRLSIKETRVASEKLRKTMKERILREGKAIDGCHAVIEFICAPIEEDLMRQEKFAEEKEKERKAALRAEREEALRPFDSNVAGFYPLGDLAEADWNALLATVKGTYETKLAQARAAEEERLAKIEAERMEKERQAAEKARLEAELAETKRLAKIEADKAAAAAKEAKRIADEEARKLRLEKAEAEFKARQEREAAEVTAREERIKANRLADEAKREREQAEVQRAEMAREAARLAHAARIEREAAEAKAREALKSEQEKARLAMEKSAREIEQTKAAVAKLERQAKAAESVALFIDVTGTDKDRLLDYAARLELVQCAPMAGEEGRGCLGFIHTMLQNTLETIRAVANRL
jgi:chemotaxis protein histidine kinase CheA